MVITSITVQLNPNGNTVVVGYRVNDQTFERYFAPSELDALQLPSGVRTGADALAAVVDLAAAVPGLIPPPQPEG